MMILLLYKDATLNRSFCSIHVRIAVSIDDVKTFILLKKL